MASKNCVFILPYFGKFKNYFNLFLKSCEKNSQFQWIIISDQSNHPAIENVKWINMSFEQLRKKVQSKFNFPICLNTPYKLCDYKPAYGYIFEDEIKEYKYWGHCDCDLIFGNLNEMLMPLLEDDYDKLFTAGHLTIYKNDYENNRIFLRKSRSGLLLHKIAYTNDKIFGFDEDYYCENVHTIFQLYNKKLYEKDISFNVLPTYYNLVRGYYVGGHLKWTREKMHPQLLLWDGKDIFTLKKNHGKIEKNTYTYAHLLMRKYTNTVSLPQNGFLVNITPNRFNLLETTADYKVIWQENKKVHLSIQIFEKFIKERYYDLKRKGTIDAEHDPYKEYR